jgi:hypothetical protein
MKLIKMAVCLSALLAPLLTTAIHHGIVQDTYGTNGYGSPLDPTTPGNSL